MRAVLKEKGQLTLPKRIRTQIGAQAGDIFNIEIVQGKVVLTPQDVTPAGAPAKHVDLDPYFGSLKGLFGDVQEIDRLVREGRDEWN